ncbi:MAG: glycosyltransferase N-terminal domain-containing protein, partial [Deltaproteobacteria bacterium]|nr:glycosyltransferase N-terminal domain-containing protein [Deltaproteobacteria bacterium]
MKAENKWDSPPFLGARVGLIRIPYNLAVAAAAGPVLLWKSLRDRSFAATIPDRLGRLPAAPRGAPVWIHAASVGEVRSAARLVERIDDPLFMTAMTPTGLALARRLFPEATTMAAPLDLAPLTARAMRRVAPRALVLVETEIWPELVLAAARQGVAVALVSARISDRTAAAYRRARALFGPALRAMTVIGAQSEADRDRLVAAGADPGGIEVTGNLKFDFPPPDAAAAPIDALFGSAGPLFVAGSTHPGEELAALRAWRAARPAAPGLRLVIAPRHLERLAEVDELLAREGARAVRRSRLQASPGQDYEVVLLDTMGELDALYRHARVAFVGGSLAPVGGHNVLEPARHGKPVLFGPHTQNFRLEAECLLNAGAARRVGDAAGLGEALAELLADPARSEAMGRAGRDAINRS